MRRSWIGKASFSTKFGSEIEKSSQSIEDLSTLRSNLFACVSQEPG